MPVWCKKDINQNLYFIFETCFEDTYHPDVDCTSVAFKGVQEEINLKKLTEDIPPGSDKCPQGVFNRRAQTVCSGGQGGQPVVFGRLVFYIFWASFFKHAWIIQLNLVFFVSKPSVMEQKFCINVWKLWWKFCNLSCRYLLLLASAINSRHLVVCDRAF